MKVNNRFEKSAPPANRTAPLKLKVRRTGACMAVLTVTSNAGWPLLQKAEALAASFKDGTDALASIVLAYSALEAFVSELEWLCSRDASVVQIQQLGVFLEALESNHAAMKSKLDAIALMSSGKKVDWGRSPFQDLAHLKLLRDWAVHPKPIVGSSEQEVADTREVQFFVQRRLIDESHIGNHPTWNSVVLVEPVARWACATVRAVIDECLEALPGSEAKNRVCQSWQRARAPNGGNETGQSCQEPFSE